MAEIITGPDLTAARAEVEAAARAAIAAGCDWARPDLALFYDEMTVTQRFDTGLLPLVASYWRRRFEGAAADPGQRRPGYISALEARSVLANAQVRLRNLAARDPQRVRGLLERLEAASDDRERALLLLSAEAASQMLPPGLVLHEAPEPPLREAQNLIARLRASGIGITLNAAGQIEIHGALSESQRDRIRTLKPEIVGLLGRPTETL